MRAPAGYGWPRVRDCQLVSIFAAPERGAAACACGGLGGWMVLVSQNCAGLLRRLFQTLTQEEALEIDMLPQGSVDARMRR